MVEILYFNFLKTLQANKIKNQNLFYFTSLRNEMNEIDKIVLSPL